MASCLFDPCGRHRSSPFFLIPAHFACQSEHHVALKRQRWSSQTLAYGSTKPQSFFSTLLELMILWTKCLLQLLTVSGKVRGDTFCRCNRAPHGTNQYRKQPEMTVLTLVVRLKLQSFHILQRWEHIILTLKLVAKPILPQIKLRDKKTLKG